MTEMTSEIRAESGGTRLDLGKEERAVWSTAFVNDLPDSSFLYVEQGGSKDDSGKTTPRTLRHFPYKDASGKVDLPHLRNALARIPQSDLPADVKARLTKEAQAILAKQGGKSQKAAEPNDYTDINDHDVDDIPPQAKYRPASTPNENCGDCSFYTLNRCSMWKVDGVQPQFVCDEWQAAAGRSAGEPELRYVVAPLTHVDVRSPEANEDGTWTMSGYAAVFNRETVLHDGRFVRLTEDIDPGFFDDILRNQQLSRPDGVVHFNFGHDMNRAVAATDVPQGMPGSLQLRADAHGLFYLAKVARDDPDGVAMASKMRTGVLKQASFAFTVDQADIRSSPLDDGRELEHRRLMRGKHLYDVCATSQGAYPQTVSQLRSYAAAIGQPIDLMGGRSRQPEEILGGVVTVSPERSGGRVELVRLRAQVERARFQLQKE